MPLIRILILWLLLALPLSAQSLFDPAASATTSPTAGEADAAARLVEILRDDAAREALIRQLEASASALQQPADAPATPQMSAARNMAEYTRALAESTTAVLFDLVEAMQSVFGVFNSSTSINWTEVQAATASLALLGAITLGLFYGLRAIGTRIFRTMGERAAARGWLAALGIAAASSVIDALLIVLAWAGGYAFALIQGETGSMDFRQSLFLNAFLLIEMTKVVLRLIFSPRFGRLRAAPISDESAAYWYFWLSRLTSLMGYGILLVVPIINAAVSRAVGSSVTVLIVVTALLIAVLIILQNRQPIAEALRRRHLRQPDDLLGRVQAAIAGFWHWLAITYLVALFLVWTARPGDAVQFMLAATLQSVLAVAIGAAIIALISRAISGGMRLPSDVKRSLPLLEERLNAFVPSILKVVRLVIAVMVVLSIGQIWQAMDFLGWVASEVGRDVTGRLVSTALIVLVAIVIWLAMSSFIEYRLNPDVDTIPTARERTLLALFRNAFTIALVVIAAMLALSELGVNIAPLLAGAGVLGLAIGFGAQKLVQDIINGAFIQFENTMNEGDVVTAGDITGVVERLTIRSVGLRDLQGTYHLVPFSSVEKVSNFMKGFAYHVVEVSVAYRENISEVKMLMAKGFDILREGELGEHVVGDFEIHGVSSLGDSSVVVRGRIKTMPGMQWSIGRAYNEIIKGVLDEAGVEIPFPHMTLYMGQNKDGSAPPLNLRRAPALPAVAPETARLAGSSDGVEAAGGPSPEVAADTPARTTGRSRRKPAAQGADGKRGTRPKVAPEDRETLYRSMPSPDEDD
ncbi:MAG: mechanosensitive ion channel domain-containing protein [Pararhodobacter sp.]